MLCKFYYNPVLLHDTIRDSRLVELRRERCAFLCYFLPMIFYNRLRNNNAGCFLFAKILWNKCRNFFEYGFQSVSYWNDKIYYGNLFHKIAWDVCHIFVQKCFGIVCKLDQTFYFSRFSSIKRRTTSEIEMSNFLARSFSHFICGAVNTIERCMIGMSIFLKVDYWTSLIPVQTSVKGV